jgi:hypothetical protein
MNQLTAHLIVFLAALAAILVLVITGHDNSNPVIFYALLALLGGSGPGCISGAIPISQSAIPSNVVTTGSPPDKTKGGTPLPSLTTETAK